MILVVFLKRVHINITDSNPTYSEILAGFGIFITVLLFILKDMIRRIREMEHIWHNELERRRSNKDMLDVARVTLGRYGTDEERDLVSRLFKTNNG